MANFVRNITKETKTFEELPEFIRNLANLVFMMNDSKGISIYNFTTWCLVAHQILLRPDFTFALYSFDLIITCLTSWWKVGHGRISQRIGSLVPWSNWCVGCRRGIWIPSNCKYFSSMLTWIRKYFYSILAYRCRQIHFIRPLQGFGCGILYVAWWQH